jgi:ketosteroid isomerase-like protein
MDPSAVVDLAARWDAATRSGDLDAIVALAEPELVFWHNYDDAEVDVATTIRTIGWLRRTVPDIAWHDDALLPTATGWVAQTTMTGTAPGGELRAHTCVVVTLSEHDRVARVAEYLDPAALSVLSG